MITETERVAAYETAKAYAHTLTFDQLIEAYVTAPAQSTESGAYWFVGYMRWPSHFAEMAHDARWQRFDETRTR